MTRLGSIRPHAAFVAVLVSLSLSQAPRAEADIYWANFESIGRAEADGSKADQSFISAPDFLPAGLATDADHLYWADFATQTIGRANLDGTDVERNFIAAGNPDDVEVEGAHLYWTNGHPFNAIGRANLDGTGVDQSFIAPVSFPCGFAVDSAHVYWNNDPLASDAITRANLDGSGVDPSFITGTDGGCGITVDDAHVYWGNGGTETIGRANLDGSGVTQGFIDPAEGVCGQIAVDGAHVYWANDGDNRIARAKLNGSGANQSFIEGADFPCDVAVEAAPFSFGKLKRNRKKGTAKLPVSLPGAGEVELDKTKKLRGASKQAEAEGSVKLPVKPKGKAKQKLDKRGKATVKAEVTFTSEGGDPETLTKRLKLLKRR